MIKKTKRISGLLLIILSLTIIGVSAYVYEQATQTITQTIVDIATITLKNTALGNLNEGQTLFYDKVNATNLGDAISIVTTTASNVNMHLDSDLDAVSASYSNFTVAVLYDTVPGGGTGNPGDIACVLNTGSPDYTSVALDAVGTWTFDFEVTTTAGSVATDVPETVTIIVSAEST